MKTIICENCKLEKPVPTLCTICVIESDKMIYLKKSMALAAKVEELEKALDYAIDKMSHIANLTVNGDAHYYAEYMKLAIFRTKEYAKSTLNKDK